MVDLVEVPVVARGPAPKRRRWRLWTALATVVLLVAGGVITAVSVSFHYLHAQRLEVNGGGWANSNPPAKSVDVGGYTASISTLVPGQPRTFYVDVYNYSDVTQTILGLVDAKRLADPHQTGDTMRVLLSKSDTEVGAKFSTRPITLNPRQAGVIELTMTPTIKRDPCDATWWDSLDMRVKVGAFTRNDKLDFGPLILELQAPGNCNN